MIQCTKLWGDFSTKVCGIPCQVVVTTYNVRKPDSGALSDWDYYGYEDISFNLLDRKGYRAKWLEKKMTQDDITKIITEIKENR